MRIVTDRIAISELKNMAERMFGSFVKAVVDVEEGTMAVDAELHADEEALLLREGSEQVNLWGINLYPGLFGRSDWIEFDAMINVRPGQGNRSRGVEDGAIRESIIRIVSELIEG
jgi:hypothetical protein